MKRITAIILALVLMFSLSVTALAADEGEEVASGTKTFENNEATSEVRVIYSNSADQLSVTVPISITFAVRSDKTFVYPTEDSYKIINSSLVPVHVTDIKVVQGGAGAPVLVTTEELDAAGEVSLTMTAGTDSIVLQAEAGASDEHLVPQNIGSGGQWNIAAGDNLPINFSNGAVYTVDPTWTDSTKLFSITYTIAAGTYITK